MQAGYDGSIRIDTRIDSTGFNNGVKSINSGLTGITSSLKKFAVAVGVAFGVKAIIDFGKASVKASTDLENALMGVQSIVEGQGRSWSKAKKFLQEYISDGLIPATQAATAYKNLAMRGYSDEQIKQTLTALKDSAAFGRQASLTMGQAVESATEGLKNENSILVDNAGVTKNVSMMWKDYAKSIGVGVQSLSKQQKIQAEVLGIMEETRFQTGDAAKIAESYSGQVLKLSYAFQNLKIAVGDMLKPVLSKIIPVITDIVNWFGRLARIAAEVTAILFGKNIQVNSKTAETASDAANSTKDLSSATKDAGNAAEKAGKQAKGALANFDELNVLAKKGGGSDNEISSPSVGNIGAEVSTEDTEGMSINPELLSSIEKLKDLLAPTVEALKKLWEQLKIIGGFVWDGLKDFYNTFLKPVGEWLFGEDSGLAKFINIIREGLEKIDWQKINDALHVLWKALTPFAINIGNGLLWFLENVLVPWQVWAMNNAIPLVIKGIAAVIDILNNTINALKPLGKWLWEKFLKPLAQWTGGIIVDVLTWIVERLQDFANWIKENEGTVQDIVIIIGSFAAALGLVTAAISLWSTVCAIASGITEIFGLAVAFLTSPIGLVVIGIGALIAVVALLAKHWDEIKGKAQETWNGVKTAFDGAGKWFDETVVTPIKNYFTEIWGSIKTAADNTWTDIKTAFEGAKKWFDDTVVTPIKNCFTEIWGGIKTAADTVWMDIKMTFENAKTWFDDTVVTPVKNCFTDIWGSIKTAADTAWTNVKTAFENAETWFKDNVVNPIKNAFRTGIDGMIGFAEGFVNRFIRGMNRLIEGINSLSFDMPEAFGGEHIGFNLSLLKEITIPRLPKLATGAVIPPNQQFMAILGDQKNGRNLEAPEGLIRQIMREELSGLTTGGEDITIKFEGNLSQLARVLNPVIKRENKRIGSSLQTGGAY